MVEQVDNRTITGTMGEKRVHESPVSQNYFGDVNAHNEFPSYLSHPRTNYVKDVVVSSEDCDGIIRVPSGSGYRIMTPFPWRLHEMLEDIEAKKLSWIVSWTPNGKAFQVHSPEHFTNTIIPMYFRHKRYKSFQRQLYLYGFRSLQVNSMSKGAYFHPCFVKDNRTLCRQIVRPKSVSTRDSRSRVRTACNSRVDSCCETIEQAVSQTSSAYPCHNGFNTHFMLGQRFNPLTDDRVATPMSSSHTVSKESFSVPLYSRQSGVVSPSVDQDVPDSSISSSDFYDAATNCLFRNLQSAMYGRDFVPLDNSPGPRENETIRYDSSIHGDQLGSIYSMSTGDTTAMNFETLLTGRGTSPLSDPQRIIHGTASIQELEPYTDSIITLFGGSDFSD